MVERNREFIMNLNAYLLISIIVFIILLFVYVIVLKRSNSQLKRIVNINKKESWKLLYDFVKQLKVLSPTIQISLDYNTKTLAGNNEALYIYIKYYKNRCPFLGRKITVTKEFLEDNPCNTQIQYWFDLAYKLFKAKIKDDNEK